MSNNNILISVSDMKKHFPIKKSKIFQKEKLSVRAIDGVSLDIYKGETIGLVGESGGGKSTFGRVLLQLYTQTTGKTMYYGRKLEEFQPKYVVKLLKNIKVEISKFVGLKEEKKKLEESNNNNPGNYDIMQKLQDINKEYNRLLLDITHILGGFIIADNVKDVAKLFLNEYKAKVQLVKLKQIYKIAKENKKDNIKHKMNECEKIIKDSRYEINQEKEKYKDNIEFENYEKNLDEGIDLAKLDYNEIRVLRKDLQIIFQDPYSSLNPRMTVGQIIGEGLLAHNIFKKNGPKMQEYIMSVMEKCGLSGYMLHRYPHQFSGGQRQRIGIARALALNPKFVVCDEAVSALDVSIQSQILNLLMDLKDEQDLTYLFITHDLSVVKYISDRVGVLYLGNLVELCDSNQIFKNPLHPYTEALISAIPTTERKVENQILLEGDVPSPIKPPKGCKFHTRCPKCMDICKKVVPEFVECEKGHYVACHLRKKD